MSSPRDTVGPPPDDASGGGRLIASTVVGRIPTNGAATVAGVRLPEGQVLVDGVFWATDSGVEQPGETWRRLVNAYVDTGLWPVVISDGRRPWQSGELGPSELASTRGPDPATVLSGWWDELYGLFGLEEDGSSPDPEAGQFFAPFGQHFPGLVLAESDRVADVLGDDWWPSGGWRLPRRLGLVSVSRPADLIGAIGWNGVKEHDDAAEVTAVLRSWEERFGAYVFQLSFDLVEFAVERPPQPADTLTFAAEMFAFNSNAVIGTNDSLTALAESLSRREATLVLRWD
jgi:hypothetical protein